MEVATHSITPNVLVTLRTRQRSMLCLPAPQPARQWRFVARISNWSWSWHGWFRPTLWVYILLQYRICITTSSSVFVAPCWNWTVERTSLTPRWGNFGSFITCWQVAGKVWSNRAACSISRSWPLMPGRSRFCQRQPRQPASQSISLRRVGRDGGDVNV